MRLVIQIIDTGFFVIFIGDFLYRLLTAKSKSNYFLRQYGWLDLLGSLPISGVRLARGVRSVRTIRLLRQYGAKNMGSELRQDRAGSTLILVLFLGILVLEFGSYFILGAEVTAATANILTASDALWWSIVTIATVGYGDKYPGDERGAHHWCLRHHHRRGSVQRLHRLPGELIHQPPETPGPTGHAVQRPNG